MKIPFGLGSYQRGAERLPKVRLINRFAEQSPMAKAGLVLLQRPGLVEYLDLPGTCRGLYKQSGVFEGAMLSVFGTTIYRAAEVVASVTGSDAVQWAYTTDGLRLLADGTIYHVDDAGDPDDFPDGARVVSIAAINDILCAIREGTQQIYYRLPGDIAWNALDFTSAEAEPDNAVGLMELAGELWAFGRSSIEIFYPTDQVNQPLQRADGRRIQRGCKDRDSIAKLDNTLFWIGEDNVAYRAAETPQRVSDHGIEERIAASAFATAWTYDLAGHKFYVVNLEEECLAYDVASGQWHQLKRHGRSGFVATGLFDGSTTYVADEQIWTLDPEAATDDGEQIERIFTSVVPTDKPMSADALEVGLSPGTSPLGTTSVIETRWSDDQGRTWSAWREASLGTEGAYRTRARIRRLGMIDAPGRVFEHRETDPSITRISDVDLNPPLGGRSR